MLAATSEHADIRKVIEDGFCIGCGACAVVTNGISVQPNGYGDLVAIIAASEFSDLHRATEVCPFATRSDETQLMQEVFADSSHCDQIVGRYESVHAGFSDVYRRHGSSGGIATHFLAALLEKGIVDHVVCVGPSQDRLADYAIVNDPAMLAGYATSFYYPVTMEQVIRRIRNQPGRYAITGVPCFHKALRLLKKHDPVLSERIVMQVGLVCGQMKSAHYSEYLARRTGKTGREKLIAACFRSKTGSSSADNYFFVGRWQGEHQEEKSGSISSRALGVNWAMSYFKPKACDYCDDVFAECADLAVMDAWLPQFVDDPQGTSLVMARSKSARRVLEDENGPGRLTLWDSNIDALIQSQISGLRHRRQGLRFRLQLMKKIGCWTPRKRVAPAFDADAFIAGEMLMRALLRRSSRASFRIQLWFGGGLIVFKSLMFVPLFVYKIYGKFRRTLEKPVERSKEIETYKV